MFIRAAIKHVFQFNSEINFSTSKKIAIENNAKYANYKLNPLFSAASKPAIR